MHPPPSRVYIDVTNACNLRCLHCCSLSGVPGADELTYGELTRIMDQAREMKVNYIVISGGEPMLRPDLFSILGYGREGGFGVTLLTNGTLIDRAAAREFAALQVRVKISLDGISAWTHDFLRGRNNFAKACRALRLLQEEGVNERAIHFTIHARNLGDLLKLPRILPGLGVRDVVIGIIKPSGRAKEHQELLVPAVLFPYIKQKIGDLSRFDTVNIQSFKDRDWEGFGCPATCNKFGITASGRSTTCVFFGEALLGGSIREHSLQELWEEYRERDAMFVPNSYCRSCPALPLSGGGCRARALYFHGDINGRDPYCCAQYEKKVFIDSHRDLCEDICRDGEMAFL